MFINSKGWRKAGQASGLATFVGGGGGGKLENGGGVAAIIRGVNSKGQCKNYLLGVETSRVWKV